VGSPFSLLSAGDSSKPFPQEDPDFLDNFLEIVETRTMTSKIKLVLLMALALTACTNSEKKITGTLELSPELQKSLSPDAVLYIIARPEGQTAGPPVAVKRFTQPIFFPLEFNLTAKDAMIPDSPFDGKFSITARIAQTGSASPAKPGDIEGSAQPNPVPVGEKNLKIVLNHVR